MIIYLASDHAGFELKAKIKKYLEEGSYEVKDCGPLLFDKDDDYPDFIRLAAEEIAKDPENSRGFIMGGGGQGEAMVANRQRGVRAAVFYGPREPLGDIDILGKKSRDSYEQIRLAREHNDANVLSFAARFLTDSEAFTAIKIFLETPFSSELRHKRRVDKF